MKQGSTLQIVGVIMAALALALPVAAQTRADATVLEMRDAHRRGQTDTLTELLPRVRGHVLEPLASYWEASARLASASPAQMRQALARHPGTYWEDRLRNDWLLHAGRTGQWAVFDAELPHFRMNDDPQVQCYALWRDAQTRRRAPAEAAEAVARLWMAQRRIEEGCSAAARDLFGGGHLKEPWVWQRARRMMEVGQIDAAVQAVDLLDPAWARITREIAERPADYLADKLTALRPRTKELVTLALIRLASTDLDAAARELAQPRWQLQLTQEERSWAWGVIGKRMAQRHRADALNHFNRGDAVFMHEDHLAWKVRAGLRAGAWASVLQTIGHMGETQRREPVWVYWRARALQALQVPDPVLATVEARLALESIASPTHFYGLLALEALDRPIRAPAAPEPLSRAEIDAAERHPGLRRALAAVALGLRSEGVREWNYTAHLHTPGGMPDRELLAAAALACRNALWDRCIHTSLRTREVIDASQRFPMPHKTQVLQSARQAGLDPALVYGLIHQESRFQAEARSGAGAAGLMQLMPATARWVARRVGMRDFRAQRVTDVNTNLTLGTHYLKLALDNFGGSMPLAAAAYNAGSARARLWRQGPELPGDIWAETIPFEETRDYVQKVLSNTTLYAALITGQDQSLRNRLGQVGPAADPDSEMP